MRILVLEYITGGGLARESLPDSLAREGELILQALLHDLERIKETRLLVLRDGRLDTVSLFRRNIDLVIVDSGDDFEKVWKEAICKVDAVWPVAPESGGILGRLCHQVADSGKTLLNSPAEVVELTTEKMKTLQCLAAHGIDVVPTVPLESFAGQFRGPWVIKPDDGVGCDRMTMIHTSRRLASMRKDWLGQNGIIQPWLDGTALSLSVLFNRGMAVLLSCNEQKVVVDHERFSLKACIVNSSGLDRSIYQDLASAVAQALPELVGYAGVDFISHGGRCTVLEINPRLTTSYAGLSRALNQNVAQMVIDLFLTGKVPGSINHGTGLMLELNREKPHEA